MVHTFSMYTCTWTIYDFYAGCNVDCSSATRVHLLPLTMTLLLLECAGDLVLVIILGCGSSCCCHDGWHPTWSCWLPNYLNNISHAVMCGAYLWGSYISLTFRLNIINQMNLIGSSYIISSWFVCSCIYVDTWTRTLVCLYLCVHWIIPLTTIPSANTYSSSKLYQYKLPLVPN